MYEIFSHSLSSKYTQRASMYACVFAREEKGSMKKIRLRDHHTRRLIRRNAAASTNDKHYMCEEFATICATWPPPTTTTMITIVMLDCGDGSGSKSGGNTNGCSNDTFGHRPELGARVCKRLRFRGAQRERAREKRGNVRYRDTTVTAHTRARDIHSFEPLVRTFNAHVSPRSFYASCS